jgi:hypothetical protein
VSWETTSEPGTRDLAGGPAPGSAVPCPLKGGAQIAHGRCVEWQRDNGCHCEFALVSLRRVDELLHLGPVAPTNTERGQMARGAHPEDDRQERLDEVRGLIARAMQMEKTRPAIAPAKEETMGVLTDRTCGWDEEACGTKLGDQNKSGFCNRHQAVLYMRKKAAEKKGGKALPAENVIKKRGPRKASPPPQGRAFRRRHHAPRGEARRALRREGSHRARARGPQGERVA